MRVAFVNQDPGVAPDRRKGAAVHLGAMRSAFGELGAHVVALDESDPARLQSRLRGVLKENSVSMVFERYALGRSEAAEVAVEWGIPFVLEVNSPLAQEALRWRGRAETRAERDRDGVLFRSANAVIAVTSELAEYASVRGARPDAIHIYPNGVDQRLFRPRSVDDRLRASLVPEGRFALGFHGRLRPWHCFDRLAEVYHELLRRDAPIHVVIVGEGDFAAELEGHVPAERRTLIDWKPHSEIPKYVAAFDALPLSYDEAAPSYFSPLKLTEAMACGVVPIVPDVGDLPRIVGSGGEIYRASKPNEIADIVEGLIQQPERRESLARAALARSAELSWRRIADFALRFAREDGP
ncbi:MAG TPA: glycosyltransferase [Vicinamibacteria bacterium]|nr:glycosyltransferase [Vicinamibacteria bacterium]